VAYAHGEARTVCAGLQVGLGLAGAMFIQLIATTTAIIVALSR
jgi:hypothetical protein